MSRLSVTGSTDAFERRCGRGDARQRVVGLDGVGVGTFTVTRWFCGAAPASRTVTVASWLPSASPVASAANVTCCEVLLVASPAVGDTASHGWSDSTVKVTGTEPRSPQFTSKDRSLDTWPWTTSIVVLGDESVKSGSEIDHVTL